MHTHKIYAQTDRQTDTLASPYTHTDTQTETHRQRQTQIHTHDAYSRRRQFFGARSAEIFEGICLFLIGFLNKMARAAEIVF